MYAKNSNSQACNDGEKNDADNISSLSTSSLFEPFATDDLGEYGPFTELIFRMLVYPVR